MHWEEITENDTWIDEFEPPKSVQETVIDVAELKTQIRLLKYRIEQLEKE